MLRAPVGFGKTTLIAQWIEQQDPATEAIAWLRVRRGSGDTNAFWTSLIDVLADTGLPLPTSAQHRSPQAVAERMIVAAGRPLLLVVDGFENVSGADIDAALVDMLWHAPNLRLIICQRSHRHFTPEQALDLDPILIGAHDLLFTAEETAELFAAVGLDLSPEQVRAVYDESGGWPEPTKTFALTLRRFGTPPDLRQAAGAIASEYLRQRLVPETNRADRVEFALATSLPDEFSIEVAELLSEDRSAKAHLEWLEGEGVLLSESRSGGPIYRWPGAARQALATELQRQHPERLPELHSRLARWYLRSGQPGRATHHAVQARNWTLVVDVIHSTWRELLVGHREQLYEALIATPLDAIATSPRAIAVRDLWLRMPDDQLFAAADLPTSSSELAELGHGEQARDTLDTGLAVLIALRRRGLFDHAHSYGDRLLEIARAARTARTSQVVNLLPGIHVQAGITRLLADDLPGALEPLQRAHEWAADSPLDYVEADAAGALALAHAVTGRTRNAITWLRRHDTAPPPSTWLAPQIRGKAAVARLLIALDHLDLEQATAAADGLPDNLGPAEFWGYYTYARLQYALHSRSMLDALDMLDRARALHRDWLDHGATAGPLLAAGEADLLLALGRGNQAHTVLHGPYAEHPLLRVGQARLALLTGHPTTALRLATDSTWTSTATARHRLTMLLIQAIATQQLDDPVNALDCLQRAVDVARASGTLRAFTTVNRTELSRLAERIPTAAETLAHPAVATAPDLFPPHITLIRLTDREQQVLNKLADGLTVQQTADALVVSYNTVKTQQRSLYQKLGAESRPDALARARQWGLIPP